MIGAVLRVLVIALVLLVAAMFLLPRPTPEVATMLDERRELPDIALIDQHGNPFALDSLAGKPTFVFFGFTNCPDICPITLAVLAAAMRDLRSRGIDLSPQVLFISVDPARDSPATIEAYLSRFDSGFIGATADAATLEPLLQAMAVSVHVETEGDQQYRVTHNGSVYVLDREARWAAVFGGSSHQPATLISDYLAMLRGL